MSASTMALPGVEVPPLSLRLPGVVWGIDVSTRRVALAALVPQGDSAPRVDWGSLTIEQHQDPTDRLTAAHSGLIEFLTAAARIAAPAYVEVEQPFGQGKARPHPQSYYMVAAVLLAVRAAAPECAVDLVEPSTWKARGLGAGKGFAKKPAILAWAREQGYEGDCPKCHGTAPDCDRPEPCHDEADAIGIATSAGVRLAGSPQPT